MGKNTNSKTITTFSKFNLISLNAPHSPIISSIDCFASPSKVLQSRGKYRRLPAGEMITPASLASSNYPMLLATSNGLG